MVDCGAKLHLQHTAALPPLHSQIWKPFLKIIAATHSNNNTMILQIKKKCNFHKSFFLVKENKTENGISIRSIIILIETDISGQFLIVPNKSGQVWSSLNLHHILIFGYIAVISP